MGLQQDSLIFDNAGKIYLHNLFEIRNFENSLRSDTQNSIGFSNIIQMFFLHHYQ